jgi:hypothetical protein
MSYTSFVETATCVLNQEQYPDVDTILSGIVTYMYQNPGEVETGHLMEYDWILNDDERDEEEVKDIFRPYFESYDDTGSLVICCDSESDEGNYDAAVFSFLVQHLCLIQESDFMQVQCSTYDSREGTTLTTSYYDSTGTYYDYDEFLSMNRKNVMEQIQEDIRSYASSIDDEGIFFNTEVIDTLCQIVVNNMNKL